MGRETVSWKSHHATKFHTAEPASPGGNRLPAAENGDKGNGNGANTGNGAGDGRRTALHDIEPPNVDAKPNGKKKNMPDRDHFIREAGKITRGALPDVDDDKSDNMSEFHEENLGGVANFFKRRRMNKEMQKEMDELLRSQFKSQKTKEEEREFGMLLAERDFADLDAELVSLEEERAWGYFDSVSGFLVIANSFTIGYEITLSDKDRQEQIRTLYIIEISFLCCFVIELAVRVCARGFKALLDMWNFFDLVLITIGFLNNIVFKLLVWYEYVSSDDLGSLEVFLILRVLRILRLVRLVRLVRLFSELTAIVGGIRHSWTLIFWAMWLIGLAVYLFSILVWDVGGNSTLDEGRLSEALPNEFGMFTLTITSMFRFAVWDNWGTFARVMIFGCGPDSFSASAQICHPSSGYLGNQAYIGILIVFSMVTSIGVLNLLVGVMITTAVEMSKKDQRTKDAKILVQNYLGLRRVRDKLSPLLNSWLRKPRDKELQTTMKNRIKEAHVVKIRKTWPYKLYFDRAGLSLRDTLYVFDEICGAAGATSIDIDDFLEGCLWIKRPASSVDVLSVDAGMRLILRDALALNERLRTKLAGIRKDNFKRACMLQTLEPVAKNQHEQAANKEAFETAQQKVLEMEKGADGRDALDAADEPNEKVMLETEHKLITDQIWARFDLFFGIFVLVNGFAIGMNAESPYFNDDAVMSTGWFGLLTVEEAAVATRYLEQIFLGVFALEFLMRAMLFYQLEYSFNYEQILGFIPPPDEVHWRRLIVTLPTFMNPRRDSWVLFDFILVSMAASDQTIRYIYGNATGANLGVAMVLRIFRIFRLFRLVRVLRLMRTLKLLVDGMLVSVRVLTFALLLLLMALFGFTIMMFELMKDDDGGETYRLEEEPLLFGGLGRGILTAFQITTYSDWSEIYRDKTAEFGNGMKGLIILVLAAAGFGLSNLVIGVMVESAFRLARQEQAKRMADALVPLRLRLRQLGTSPIETLIKQRSLGSLLAQQKSGKAWNNRRKRVIRLLRKWGRFFCFFFMKKSDAEKEAEMEMIRQESDTSDAWLDIYQISDVMNFIGHVDDPKTIYQMDVHTALRDAGLDWKRLFNTLSKLDCKASGKVRLNEVMECLVRAKRDVDGLDVTSARGTFRRLTRKSRAIDYMSEDLGNAIKSVLHKFTAVDSVESRTVIRDALLERRRHLGEVLDVNLDTLPKNTKVMKMVLRSAHIIQGDEDVVLERPEVRDDEGHSVAANMSAESPVVKFESAQSRDKRIAASTEGRRNIFEMD
jgi:hypothetical protein